MSETLNAPAPAPDPVKLEAFMGRFVAELGACMAMPNVIVGDKLGLYRALAGAGPLTPDQLARHTGTDARYVQEWLAGQAAGGYVDYDAASERYVLTPEQAACLADPDSPTFIPGAFYVAASLAKDEPKLTEAFRTGAGVGWHEHHGDLFCGTELFFRPGYAANLVTSWIPALDGVTAKLEAGGSVADVGCGHGASTLIMARTFPRSRFVGYDYHDGSIAAARAAGARSGLTNVSFEIGAAKDYPATGYDLVTMFDCLHDMGDPVGAARHVRSTLAPGGTWMVVEPMAGDSVQDNLNPIGRIFYNASTLICTPASRAQEVGLALGAQAGEARLSEVLRQGGFTRIRRATETPFNLVLEARA